MCLSQPRRHGSELRLRGPTLSDRRRRSPRCPSRGEPLPCPGRLAQARTWPPRVVHPTSRTWLGPPSVDRAQGHSLLAPRVASARSPGVPASCPHAQTGGETAGILQKAGEWRSAPPAAQAGTGNPRSALESVVKRLQKAAVPLWLQGGDTGRAPPRKPRLAARRAPLVAFPAFPRCTRFHGNYTKLHSSHMLFPSLRSNPDSNPLRPDTVLLVLSLIPLIWYIFILILLCCCLLSSDVS